MKKYKIENVTKNYCVLGFYILPHLKIEHKYWYLWNIFFDWLGFRLYLEICDTDWNKSYKEECPYYHEGCKNNIECNGMCKYQELFETLDEIANEEITMEDGETGKISPEVIENCKKIIKETEDYIIFVEDIDIYPTSFESICIEWTNLGETVSLEIDKTKMGFYYEDEFNYCYCSEIEEINEKSIENLKSYLDKL